MEYEAECIECNHNFITRITEYGETEIECPECKSIMNVLYSEDCSEDYSDCWDTYWIEEIEG